MDAIQRVSASYQVIPIVRRSKIEPGETVEIEIFITGSGDVESAKLQALHTQEDLIDEDEPGEMVYSVDFKRGDDGCPELVMGEDALKSRDIDNWGTMAFVTEAIFYTPSETDSSDSVDMNGDDFEFQPIVGEAAHGGNPPLLLRLKTKGDARPGDYQIPFILTYGEEDAPLQSKATVDIHVQSWVERHRKVLEILAIAGTMAIVITSIVSIIAVT